METIFQKPAWSEIKTRLKLAEIKQINPRVISLKTEMCYYIDVKRELNPEETEKLNWFFATSHGLGWQANDSFLRFDNQVIEVGPRLGLVTPFSTSAGAIFSACGLNEVINRIEAARRFCLVTAEGETLTGQELELIAGLLHDQMTEQVYPEPLTTFQPEVIPESVKKIPLLSEGVAALRKFAAVYGLGFTPAMEDYILSYFETGQRDPTDVELFMFGQLNSEHCRHHIFNGAWTINGEKQSETLMEMVRSTVQASRDGLKVAFSDNAAVLNPSLIRTLIPVHPESSSNFTVVTVSRGMVLKIETHNHPTTVSPYEGAATGVAVRRDIFGTGRGGVSVAHLAGYYVGHLFIPGYTLPWEKELIAYSPRFATPLKILIGASNGASDNCNCFGNPVILGTTRSFEQLVGQTYYGYRKTAMVAGSFGYIDERHVQKREPKISMLVVQTGGQSFPIGVGGGSGSSKDAGGQGLGLDFNSVQRGDAFTERSNFNVIRACSELGDDNPIVTLTDLGAGGDCVAIPELVFPVGANIELRQIPCGDKTMPVWVYWCNESQERMAYIIREVHLPLFQKICERHRCPMSVLGKITDSGRFILTDREAGSAEIRKEQLNPINLSMDWLLADLPQRQIDCQGAPRILSAPHLPDFSVMEHLNRVWRLVDVGSKEFLTRKADRTVGNRSVRQQEVGPLQLPLADCAVISDGPFNSTGGIIAIGEQPLKGLVDNEAGIRLSIGEALTNAVWAPFKSWSELNFSATWQWPCGQPGEDARLYLAVEAARDCLIRLMTRIGVGKDSLSMTLKETNDNGKVQPILAPGTVQMTVFGPCSDIDNIITPDIKMPGKSKLMLIDLASGSQRLGGSALLRVHGQIGDEAPDLDRPEQFKSGLLALQELMRRGLILAGHDRSDGGLITCVSEMAFSGNCGLKLNLQYRYLEDRGLKALDINKFLFNEELGLVIEFLPENLAAIRRVLRKARVNKYCYVIGETRLEQYIIIKHNRKSVLTEWMPNLREIWRSTSFRLDELQSTPEIVQEWRINTKELLNPEYSLTFKPKPTPNSVMIKTRKPKAAILSEAGTNGDRDAAETCYLAGYTPVDIHMTDLLAGRVTLQDCQLLFWPGGFSFRDTFGAGRGAAGVFKFNSRVADELSAFISRQDTLMIGPCNGCQEMARLGIVPWANIPAGKQPLFVQNRSERFEHQLVTVEILPSNSVFFQGMEGSKLGIIISHGEGRFHCPDKKILNRIIKKGLAPIRYVDNDGAITEKYPFNPNGSPLGIAGLSSEDGRFLALMPHPERLPLNNLWPWQPLGWKKLKASPWLRVIQNARDWHK